LRVVLASFCHVMLRYVMSRYIMLCYRACGVCVIYNTPPADETVNLLQNRLESRNDLSNHKPNVTKCAKVKQMTQCHNNHEEIQGKGAYVCVVKCGGLNKEQLVNLPRSSRG
jgi:hypothetical protein